MRRSLSIDFETASTVDLRRAGVDAYARHPDTRVLCMAYAFDNDPVQVWNPAKGPVPLSVYTHIASGGIVRGWNVKFEQAIWNHTLRYSLKLGTLKLGTDQLRDTMAQAAYYGLPLSLDMAADALGTKNRKSKSGHKLMLQMCRPRTKSPLLWWHETDTQKFMDLMSYCLQDVEVEREIANSLPELPDRELQIWRLDNKINARGVHVDKGLVSSLEQLAGHALHDLKRRMYHATGGLVPSHSTVGAIQNFLNNILGVPIPDLRKDTIKAWLPKTTGVAREVLTIRREAARTSASKLKVLHDAAPAGIIRGMLQHYGAPRTGRWAGRLFQPQNLPRGTVKHIDKIIDLVLAGADYDVVDALASDSVMGVVASAIRGCLIAGPGNVLVSADLSQIEARVVAWLAGQTDILAIFADPKQDPYVYTANRIGSDNRQLGKVCVLGLGFGMGWQKFIETAKVYGIVLTEEQAVAIVSSWRRANKFIQQFWWDIDDAARRCIIAGHMDIKVGKVTVSGRKGYLVITLPSGRRLFYRNPRLEFDPKTNREAIVFDGLNQYTRQWGACRTYGGKLVENIVQATARDVMADALMDMERYNVPVILTVHDEAISSVPAHQGPVTLGAMVDCMTAPRVWTAGLPIGAAGWVGPRYKKG